VMSGEQDFKEIVLAQGRPPGSYKFDPPVYALKVARPHHTFNTFYFLDEDLANRVAKAFVHAVELCGGGSKDPF
jgi:hypothetical protein